ncbi:SEP domain-containing protein [Pavlovales sp. CCMP2436]|nr:SEP domain-containing protein [Pavlovales sp. CCMP2436]
MANVRGLRDLNDEEEEEKRQAYYAGGQGQNGGGSGQQILDPREFMRRARDELGARSIDEYNAERSGSAFDSLGAGRSLAAADAGDAAAAAEGAAEGAPAGATQAHTITFWRDGFTVDAGPLRRTEDPENAQFLADINRGQVPRELEASSGGADIDVHCIDKSTEAHVAPPASVLPFQGEGRSMRTDAAAGSTTLVEPREAALDTGAPTTSIQLRMADGLRKVLKLNHTHTVGQLRAHVATLTPAARPFEIAIPMPRAKLTDDAQTLAEAGLLNNTVVVTML